MSLFGIHFKVSTSLRQVDDTFIIHIEIWKIAIDIGINIYLVGKNAKRKTSKS